MKGPDPMVSTDRENVHDSLARAGGVPLKGSPRRTFSFGTGWKFRIGEVKGAAEPGFDDSAWELVSLPHSVDLVPEDASGGRNYQGPAWYRKSFRLPKSFEGKRILVYFEAIMGKSTIWLNGTQLAGRRGGYLPVVADISDFVHCGDKTNHVAVRADNSDDPSYPPGKPQRDLDFTYMGGIYRDAYLVVTNGLHISDPILADETAGGGVFVRYEDVSKNSASVLVKTHVVNGGRRARPFCVETVIRDANGRKVRTHRSKSQTLAAGDGAHVQQTLKLSKPTLWHPDSPYLYTLCSHVISGDAIVDSMARRIGLRTFRFDAKRGFLVNGAALKLSGVNRHQDYAFVGNAMPNSAHVRDAVKWRQAGINCIRSAHYPQDPAFMDMCDELGMCVIVATPGWQFFNEENPDFSQRAYQDVREMVRLNRNRPSVFLWEPVLNETSYPKEFAQTVYDAVHEEYPGPDCYAAQDVRKFKSTIPFDVAYSNTHTDLSSKPIFRREYGEVVEIWEDQNFYNRVHRNWGEGPMILQCETYAKSLAWLYNADYMTGACLWHGTDHQRGYHPDPFWGGLMDVYRLPKYSYYLFMSQRDPKLRIGDLDMGPMIYVAHELTPHSPRDICIFTNCEEVRLKRNGHVIAQGGPKPRGKMPHPPVVFKNAYRYLTQKYNAREDEFVAEGLIRGKVVARHVRKPSGRKTQLIAEADGMGVPLIADGSDFVTIYVHVADEHGTPKAQAQNDIWFEVEGEGELINRASIQANPFRAQFGTATALVRATNRPGEIRFVARAFGLDPAVLTLESRPPSMPGIPARAEE